MSVSFSFLPLPFFLGCFFPPICMKVSFLPDLVAAALPANSFSTSRAPSSRNAAVSGFSFWARYSS